MKKKEDKNRDVQRQNKASTLITANLYSNVVTEGIKASQKITNALVQSSDIQFIKSSILAIKKINDIILEANAVAKKKYCHCSSMIKSGAICIAHRETQIIKNAIRCKETIALDSVLRHYEKKVVDMQVSIVAATSIVINTEIGAIPTIIDNSNQSLQSNLKKPPTKKRRPKHKFTKPLYPFILPSPDLHKEVYSPLQAVLVVLNNLDKRTRIILDVPRHQGKYVKHPLTRYYLIQLLIRKKFIPVNKTKMYSLLASYAKDPKSIPNWWHPMYNKGPKPHLNPDSFSKLTSKFHKVTEGGCAMSKDELRNELSERLVSDTETRTGVKYKHDTVPETTLRRYVNDVISHFDFNIFTSVSNKTESRYVSEFSIRSTISFLLVVLTTHFIRGVPTVFHKSKKELEKNPTWKLAHELNKKVLGIGDTIDMMQQFIHVLPHLITSTDECSLFITTQIINNKQCWYFSTRPKKGKTPTEDSNKRDIFSTKLVGDAHMRGVRISVNNTFTAGGRSAPIFACVYGLSLAEMPKDEIVLCEIEGLVPASNQNGSKQKGFICFIRGADSSYLPDDEDNTDPDATFYSKDAKIAKLYREKVYYPFIHDIRTNYYLMPEPREGEAVPSEYTAISWMDGCHGQLNMTTNESVLDKEAKLGIVSCKQSAARTGVEQPADAGPMFKIMKGVIKVMPTESITVSPIFYRITKALDALEKPTSSDDGRVVKLSTMKKKSIIAGVSKLPVAMSAAFKEGYIQSAFKATGHIDKEGMLPCVKNMVGTYRGTINDLDSLADTDKIINTFYDDVYLNGRIEEEKFDKEGVVRDYDKSGKYVSRDFGISKENCQRAKILSCKTQRQARLDLIESIKLIAIQKQTSMYETEDKRYRCNSQCEERLSNGYYAQNQLQLQTTSTHITGDNITRKTFKDLKQNITVTHFGRNDHKGFSTKFHPTMEQMKVFIQLRTQVTKFKSNRPVYKKVDKYKKEELIDNCMSVLNQPLQPRIYKAPVQEGDSSDDEDSIME